MGGVDIMLMHVPPIFLYEGLACESTLPSCCAKALKHNTLYKSLHVPILNYCVQENIHNYVFMY